MQIEVTLTARVEVADDTPIDYLGAIVNTIAQDSEEYMETRMTHRGIQQIVYTAIEEIMEERPSQTPVIQSLSAEVKPVV